ncbi:MAG: agmatine deiminase family protein [Ignavibacteriaceae bacterium]|nr:agmatine deiminase family protein [Ignavibacteriaceae bacterium]
MNSSKSFRLPAEWEQHEATWIGWPYNKNDWPGKFSPVPFVYAEIVKHISRGEKVRIFVQSKDHQSKAEKVLKDSNVSLSNVGFFIKKTDRGWLRDSGPMFVKEISSDNEQTILIDFKFNAWAKYDDFKNDDRTPSFISKKMKLPKINAAYNGKQVVLEGGSIDCNGNGALLTTEECLLDEKIQVRNPGFTKNDYLRIFKEYLGINEVIWLGKGVAGDDTHGHVDDLCRFVNKNTVVLVSEKNPSDENYYSLNENRERLENYYLSDGSKINLVLLPMPSPQIYKSQRLPASYANFYISNSTVLVPTFNDSNDRIALGIISELFPGREVIGIHSVDLVWGLGTIHCLTKEQVK